MIRVCSIVHFFALAGTIIAGTVSSGTTTGVSKIKLHPTVELQRADIYFLDTKEVTNAVLVLCPGCNGNGEYLLQDQKWLHFAKKNHLGLAALSFASNTEDLQNHRGYYIPSRGSGKLLVEALQKHFGKISYLIFYGFSGGAHFVSGFVGWRPDLVRSWCAYSAEWWEPSPSPARTPAGIIACGEYDAIRYNACLSYYSRARAGGAPWTWVSLQKTSHSANEQLEEFARNYFAAILQGDGIVEWRDIDTKALLSSEAVSKEPRTTVWLPSGALGQAWCALHHP